MKKAFIAEGALNLALACSTGTGDAEKAEPVAFAVMPHESKIVKGRGTLEFTQEDAESELADWGYGGGVIHKLYTEQQLNELICQLSPAKSLSVTNILINVAPGEDGMGEEVYAKSVEDVERLIASLSERVEASLEAERTWETMMMQAIGEDGPGSVSTAIGLLKQQRDKLLMTLKRAEAETGFINCQELSEVITEISADLTCWQPIETAPKTGETLLGFDPSWYDLPCPMFWNDRKSRWQFFQINEEIRATHWMPLPATPKHPVSTD